MLCIGIGMTIYPCKHLIFIHVQTLYKRQASIKLHTMWARIRCFSVWCTRRSHCAPARHCNSAAKIFSQFYSKFFWRQPIRNMESHLVGTWWTFITLEPDRMPQWLWWASQKHCGPLWFAQQIKVLTRRPAHASYIICRGYSGYDIEDAIIMNRAALDRGFGRCFWWWPWLIARTCKIYNK